MGEPRQQFVGREERQTRSGELDRQRQPVEPAANLRDRTAWRERLIDCPSAFEKKRDRIELGERIDTRAGEE